VSALQSAINDAKAGDIIIMKSGVYSTTEDIKVDKVGTAKQPIVISAEQIGSVEITGAGGFNIASPATWIIIKGFKFTHAASKAKTGNGTSFCQWTRNIFETPGTGEYLTISGSDHQVDYNTFQHKKTLGRFIAIRGSGKQIAERLWIHHNYFNGHTPQVGNGAEAFQFGLSGFSLSSSNSIVEHNLFENCAGENELLSVKASAVTVRYNTVRDCPAHMTLRHGNHCQVYGNYFINTPGLRFFGDDHFIFSNYFENCKPAIMIGNGGAEVADGAPLTSHDRPDRVLLAFNTLVNNQENIVQTPRNNGLGATYIKIVNNIIQGGPEAAKISGPAKEWQWMNNIIFQVKHAGDIPPTGYATKDPALIKNNNGVFHLKKGSAATDKATGVYPKVIVDMDGQQRVGRLDIGADELSNTKVVARMLMPADVGHSAPAAK
jgi:poly(beta-D-mannuronate) lyase